MIFCIAAIEAVSAESEKPARVVCCIYDQLWSYAEVLILGNYNTAFSSSGINYMACDSYKRLQNGYKSVTITTVIARQI